MVPQVKWFLCPDKQGTPEEGQRIQRLKCCVSTNDNRDVDNSQKNHSQNIFPESNSFFNLLTFSKFVCIYVYACMHICVCICEFVCMGACRCAYVSVCECVCTCLYMHSCVCAFTRSKLYDEYFFVKAILFLMSWVSLKLCVYMYDCACMHMYVCIWVCACVCAFVNLHVCVHGGVQKYAYVSVCVYECLYMHLCECMHVYVCACLDMHLGIYTCLYFCLYVCM